MKISPRHAQARALALAGIPVFPCEVNGKRPATAHGFKDANTDLAQIDAHWTEADYNIGMEPRVIGCGVVDVDGAEGRANWEALPFSQERTYTVATPSGGVHVYYRGDLPPTASKIAPNIDTRGVGSYVLVPPSCIDGKVYEVIHDVEPLELPILLRELTSRKTERVTASDTELDRPGSIERGRSLLTSLIRSGDVAVSGQGGNDRTYRLACELSNLGLSQEMVQSLIEEPDGWNAHCEPPWDSAELETLIEHASAYAQNEPGAWSVIPAAEAFGQDALDKLKADTRPQESEQQWKPRPIASTDEWHVPKIEPTVYANLDDTQPPEPVRELIAGWLEEGMLTLLEGPAGAQKSRLALHHCTVLANQLAAYGDQPAKHCRSVYLNYENPGDEMKRRVYAASRFLYRNNGDAFNDMADIEVWNLRDDPTSILRVTREGELRITAFGDKFLDGLAKRHDHTFLVVDNLMDAFEFEGNTRNEDAVALRAIKALEQMCSQLNLTMLSLIHPARTAQRGGFQGGMSYAPAWITRTRCFQSLSKLEPKSKGESVPANVFVHRVVKRSHGQDGATQPFTFFHGTLKPGMDITAQAAGDT